MDSRPHSYATAALQQHQTIQPVAITPSPSCAELKEPGPPPLLKNKIVVQAQVHHREVSHGGMGEISNDHDINPFPSPIGKILERRKRKL